MPAGYLQKYFNTIEIPHTFDETGKPYTIISKNIYKNIFSVKLECSVFKFIGIYYETRPHPVSLNKLQFNQTVIVVTSSVLQEITLWRSKALREQNR